MGTPSGLAGRVRCAALLALACVAAAGCTDRSALPFIAEVPEGAQPAPASYPNINDNPERPSELRSPEEVKALEKELESLRQSRIEAPENLVDGVRRTA